MKMARRFLSYIGCCIGLLLIDSALGCKDTIKCPKSTESIALSVILCIAGVAAILCPLLCLIGPFKRLAIRWRTYLHDKLGLEYPERDPIRQRQSQVEYDVPPEYVNIAFIDLPPSYDEVIKNSQYYNYGLASSSASAPEQHHPQLVCHERTRPETCHQITSRLEYVNESSSNTSTQESSERTNNILSSITVQDAVVTNAQEQSERPNNMHRPGSIMISNASFRELTER